MANTFAALLPILYQSAQTVSRELVGFVRAVDMRFDDREAGQNQTVRVPIAPTRTVSTYTPAMTTTAGTDSTEGYADVVLTNSYQSTFNMTGEQLQALKTGGITELLGAWMQQEWTQCMRAVINQIESDLAGSVYQYASRATGTAGTTPFGSDITPAAKTRKILDDNGAPRDERSLVLSTSGGLNMRSLTQLTNYYQTNTNEVLVDGSFFPLFNQKVYESGQLTTATTPGTGSGYVIDGTGNTAVGSTVLKLKTGSGTIVAGDIITIQSDTNNYVVTGALSGGLVTIGNPGLRIATADSKTVTVGGAYTPNVALQKNAFVGVVRPPYIPPSPLITTYDITDPLSGLTLKCCEVVGDGMVTYRVHAVTGYKGLQSQHICTLMG